jgi:hypothetical protein
MLALLIALTIPLSPVQGVAAASPVPLSPPESAPASPPVQAFAPGTQYDTAIPTLKQVVGHDWGEEITTPDGILAYLKALATAAPDRTRLVEYARSWEGRPLHVLVVGSRDRMARLDQVKADLRRLADPRGLAAAEAERLVRELPSVVWLIHAVHGNEISSSDAALLEAYHLLAGQDPAVTAILRDSIVLIDPLQNPDGRARFVLHTVQGRAASPDAEPGAAEHDEPWPGGRSNHYLFDMNRDWFAQSQPETRGRTRVFLEWFPHVVVDLHEMGGNSTYYFAPPADPLNPFITKPQADWFATFGRDNARAFDARGFPYFTREVFDSFYPGYGESWPLFHGAIGMTYEMASSRGLVFRREDETLLTFRDGVLQHFTAAISTLSTAAANRERLLRDFLEYRRSAIADGERGAVREYLVPPGMDPSRAGLLASLLVRQGLEVRRATQPLTAAGRSFPAGTYLVSAAQPGSRLLRNLMEPHVPQPELFLKEQDRRRRKRLSDQIYDITAWSLPFAFDVEVVASAAAVQVASSPVVLPEVPTTPGPPLPSARVGYLLPWGSGTAAAVTAALRQGLRVRSVDRPFTLGGRRYLGGTALLRVSDNPADLPARLGALVGAHQVEAVPIDSAFVEEGTSLGSNEVATLKPPRVLLLWDVPTQSMSAGWARFVLERRFGHAVTAVRGTALGRVELERFDVVVLPAGNYGNLLGGDALRRLRDWVSRGGTLITIGEASRWAARENVALLDTRTELRDGKPEVEPSDKDQKDQKKAEASPAPFDLEKAIQPERERPEVTPGAMLRVLLDPEHWLSAGTDGEIQTIVEGQRVFRPITVDKGRNVGVYQTKDKLVAGGLAWPEAQDLLAQKAWLIHQPLGSGHVVAFAEDPNYRAFAEASQLLFVNAVLLGPAH